MIIALYLSGTMEPIIAIVAHRRSRLIQISQTKMITIIDFFNETNHSLGSVELKEECQSRNPK